MLLQYRDAGAAENTRHRRGEAAGGLGLELGEKNGVGRGLASQQTLAAVPNGGVMVKCLNTYDGCLLGVSLVQCRGARGETQQAGPLPEPRGARKPEYTQVRYTSPH